jgi:PmbA protein
MSNNKNQQQEFRELADWVISLTKKAGADECRVNISKNRFVEINYREKKPEVIKEATTQGLYLEVFVNNRFSGQSTPDFRKSTLESFITGLIDNAKLMEEDPYRTLPDPKYYTGKVSTDLQLADPGSSQLTPEERHAMARTVEDACLQKGGDKVISVEAGEYDETYEEFVKSSNGFEGTTKSTNIWTGATMTAQDEGDRRPAGNNWVGCRFREDLPSLQEVGFTAATRTLDLMGGKKIQTETMPVIIQNRVAMRVLGGFLNAMTGGNIQQKRSFLADRKGQVVGSNVFTLVDDPFIIRALGSKYYDDDGFPAKKRELITQGKLNEFIIDWYYSRKLECEPTSGSISNLIIPPGTRDLESIVNDLDRCILVTDFIGGNSNSTTGDFSVGIIGKLYDKGKFVQAIAEMNIADNHLNFWNKLNEAANDTYQYSSARMPSLVFKDVVVAGI